MADVQAKRDAAIKAKDDERKKKNAEIAESKKGKAAEREAERSAKEKEAAEAEAKKAELEKKRNGNIENKTKSREERVADSKKQAQADRERAREAAKNKGSSKYSKKDVYELKAVFDEYDKDRSGKVTLEEFMANLKKKKEEKAPRPGEKSTLAQRQANEGISILDLAEGTFHEMDKDGDGEVTFRELLKLFYRFATEGEIETMLTWVAEPEPEPEPEKPALSAEAVKMIKDIFKLYDKDKSGTLTIQELRKALEKTGIDVDEIKGMFKEYDADENGTIDQNEFFKLMESTGAFDDQ